MALAHCVAVSTCFRIVDETICDIDDTTTMEFRYEDEDYLKRESMGFARGRGPLYGCARAIVGIAIKAVEPWAGTTANSPIRTVYTMHKACDARRTGAELCAGADAYSQASKRDLRRQALEWIKLPKHVGSAANRYPPRKFYDSQTMPSKQFFPNWNSPQCGISCYLGIVF
jgi:hypothetical protein